MFQTLAVKPHMSEYQVTIPETLPGVDVAFGLKQCVGNPELIQGLLHRFWTDYHNS